MSGEDLVPTLLLDLFLVFFVVFMQFTLMPGK